MKIKLDENLPARLGDVLSDLGHDIDTVIQERLAGHSDAEVWEAAQRAERFLITQDLDFSDIRRVESSHVLSRLVFTDLLFDFIGM